jgi:hypothetical protein
MRETESGWYASNGRWSLEFEERTLLEAGVVVVTLYTAATIMGLAYAVDPEAVVIEPIRVPEELIVKGYSSTVVSDRVTEEMHRIHEISEIREEVRGVSLGSSETSVSALEKELDITGLVWIVRDQFDIKQFKIEGEIVNAEKGLEFRLRGFPRTGGMMVAVERGTMSGIDDLIARAAEEALRFSDPYVLAVYYFGREEASGEFTETLGAIQAGLGTDRLRAHNALDEKRLYALWARVNVAQKDYVAAVNNIKQAFKIDPTYGMAYHMWCGVLFAAGNYEGAIEKCAIATKHQPNMPAFYDVWGNSLDALGYPEKAQVAYEIAIKLDPDFAHVHFSRGNVYCRLKNYEETIRHYISGLSINPDHTEYTYNIAQTRKALGIDSQ